MNTHKAFGIAITLAIGLWATGCAHNSATPNDPYFTGYHKADGAGLTVGVVDRAAIAEAIPNPARGGSTELDANDDWAMRQYYMDRYMLQYPNNFAIDSYWGYNNLGYNRYRMRLRYGNHPPYWGSSAFGWRYDPYGYNLYGYNPYYDPYWLAQSPWYYSSYPYHFYPFDQPLNYYGYSGYNSSWYNYGYPIWGSGVTQSGDRKLRRPRDRDGGQRVDNLIPSFGRFASTINTSRPTTKSKPAARPKKDRDSAGPSVSTRGAGRKKGATITRGGSSKPVIKSGSRPKSTTAKKPSSSGKKSRPVKRKN